MVAGTLATSACTDETIVFRDRELFETPVAAAAGFVGYTDEATKLTVCGNCHVGPQSQWEESGHADAWDGLQDSGHAQEFCESCHTVSELGNVATGTAGYSATAEDRYHDVQCESCHGPGLDHVTNPSDPNIPLAPMDVSVDGTLGCGECHQGSHHPFAEEWAQSGHGDMYAGAQGRSACQSCHTGEGALNAFGVSDPYIEKGGDAQGNHFNITCAVCHDPHGSDFTAQLRYSIDVADEDQNLCMKCHHKRGIPDPTSFRGPHSPQGPLLIGDAGWWPPNLDIQGDIVATHGSEANPGLCAGCHVNSYEVTDAATGEFVVSATGHRFLATPCVDANGAPTASQDCAEEEKNYEGCAVAGCHGSAQGASAANQVAQLRLTTLAAEIDRLVALVPATEFDSGDNRYTTGEGAKFNAGFAGFAGSASHNPFLVEALMIASIEQLKTEYGLAVTAEVSMQRQLVPGGALR
ncbi:MAG: cytochrome c family protein [Gemmatimonadetes bacterium]|nr:cytochrome c family protein [Gemmatimonadota bacterium]